MPETLANEITALINKHSREAESDTPDFILANYLMGCLRVFERAVQNREAWHGRKLSNREPISAAE